MSTFETWQGLPSLAVLKGKLEDRFTLYLSELLLSPAVLSSFIHDVCGLQAERSDLSAAYVTTWMTVENGFPDLVVQLPNDLLIVEIKVDSPLNDWQIRNYATHLIQWSQGRPERCGHLFVLTPFYSSSRSLAEATNQATEAGFGRPVAAITWEDVGRWCLGLALKFDGSDTRLRFCLEDFSSLISTHLGSPPRPFRDSETAMFQSRDVGAALSEACRLLSRIETAFEGSRVMVKPYKHLQHFRNACFGFEVSTDVGAAD